MKQSLNLASLTFPQTSPKPGAKQLFRATESDADIRLGSDLLCYTKMSHFVKEVPLVL